MPIVDHDMLRSLFLFSAILTLAFAGCRDTPESVLRKTRANRLAFDKVYCEFTYRFGTFNNAQDLQTRQLGSVQEEMSGRYVKDGKYELLILDNFNASEDRPLDPVYIRTPDMEYLFYSSYKSATRFSRRKNEVGKLPPQYDPWFMGIGRSGFIDNALQHRCEILPNVAKHEERSESSYYEQDSSRFSMLADARLEFDKKKAYLGVEGRLYGGVSAVVESIESKGRGFFPTRVVRYSVVDDEIWPRKVVEWKATKLEFRNPTDEEMTYVPPNDVNVSDYLEVISTHKILAGTKVRPQALGLVALPPPEEKQIETEKLAE